MGLLTTRALAGRAYLALTSCLAHRRIAHPATIPANGVAGSSAHADAGRRPARCDQCLRGTVPYPALAACDELMRSILSHIVGSDRESAFEFAEVIRAEIFSAERLEQHAASLAAAQTVTTRPVAVRPLTARLRDNHRALLDAHRAIAKSIAAGGAITPAAEWLVDNYHVVEAQIRQVRDDLPPGYYRQLPKLADGPLAGYPRVLGLAWAFVAHTDSRFDAQPAAPVRGAYQRVQPLTIGELWAIAITLADRAGREPAACGRADREPARRPPAGRPPGGPAPRRRRTGRRSRWRRCCRSCKSVQLSTTFAVQLLQRLRDQDPEATPALTWLEARLATAGTTADEVVRDEHQRQGASSVTVRNVITSMRSISAVDWADLFEAMSLVDAVLRADADLRAVGLPDAQPLPPRDRGAGAGFAALRARDRASTRCRSRARVATPARARSGLSPHRGGRRAFEDGSLSAVAAGVARPAHRRAWESAATSRASRCSRVVALAWPLSVLLSGGVGVLTLAVLAACRVSFSRWTLRWLWRTAASRAASAPGPCRDWSCADGIAADLRTLVVVPVMLTTPRGDRRAHRTPGDPPSGEPGRRRQLRAALGLDRCGGRAGRRATRRCSSVRSRASLA